MYPKRCPLFVARLPLSALPTLFRHQQLYKSSLQVNKRNRNDAYVYFEELDDDIYICDSKDRNRALGGDMVAVKLVDVEKVLTEKQEKEEAKLVRNGSKLRLPVEENKNEIIFGGEEEVHIVKLHYCGVVVAILERTQNQVFSVTLTLTRHNNKRAQAEEARKSISGPGSLIQQRDAPSIVWFKATDKLVPLVAIPVEQAPKDFIGDNNKSLIADFLSCYRGRLKVLDVALSIRKIDENYWEVGVHICDISHFIKLQSAMDKEARSRGVRVDLAHMHVPMHPEILTEQATNLKPNETRQFKTYTLIIL
ncbi:MAG: hypothetical protein EXX96DRAFT_536053 [Benjaminiella poitrasii]|nr:MAG: hypothetical protein EXX96DRAFT_536053 [Benjaminiella poitrasii]